MFDFFECVCISVFGTTKKRSKSNFLESSFDKYCVKLKIISKVNIMTRGDKNLLSIKFYCEP